MFSTILVAAALLSAQSPDTLSVARVVADRSITASSAAPLRIEGRVWMDRAGAKDLSEVLRGFAGVSVKDYGGLGGMKTVSLRGFGSQHTGVSYDGICITDMQNGQVDLSQFNLDNLESVSVTIGQGSEIFRSARSLSGAGMLELRSARPVFTDKSSKTTVRAGAGSFGTWTGYMNHQHKLSSRFSLSADATLMHSDGDYPYTVTNGSLVTTETRLGSEVQSARGEVNLYGDVGRTGTLTAKLSGRMSDRGLPGPVILYTQDPTEHLWDRGARADVVWSASPTDRLQVEAKGSVNWSWNRYTDTSAVYQQMEDERFSQLEHYVSGVAMLRLTDHLRISAAEDMAYNTLATSFEDCPFPKRLTSLTSAAFQYSSRSITATATLLGTFMTESVETGTAAPDRKRLSPAVSVVWHAAPGLHLRAGWKDSFRAPTFNDLYYSKIGNTSLQPEKASQFNAGASWAAAFRNGHAELGLDMYHNDVRDKIVATPTMFIWRMRNLGKVSMTGADLTAAGDWELGHGLSLHGQAAYSFLYAVDVTDPESKSWKNQIAYTPRNSGSCSIGLDSPWVNVCYTLVAVGERFVLGQNKPANRIAPYWDHGVALSHAFRMRGWAMTLSAEALNLADVNYEIIKCYPMPGRNYRISIKFTI